MTDNRGEGLEERRKRLAAELAERKQEAGIEEAAEKSAEQSRKGYAQAMKLSSEFISAIVVGALLGYLFDRFVGTAPWGMIVLLLLGFCAGVLNVLRSAGMVSTPHPADRAAQAKNERQDGDSRSDQ
ncbi:MAG: AtpZ/AtpI family protein, partial [Rhizobiaceae bacterium]|nr:AtpZ/AtpI family protein [Rhizobiaceae bacterium]